ncbi:MAG: hypothetical protein P1V81_06835, partial [Planctomycetota bacterium]|nr:hypothetical protein [Planctomycetota bacterium]
MKLVNVLLAVLVSIAIAFGVFEGGLRLSQFAPTPVANQFDAQVGWAKKPNLTVQRSTLEFDVTIETNEFGLRDDSMLTKEKPADTFRVLALGDSFTMGYVLDRDELFIDLLEDWWQSEGRKIEIINAGVEGYSTDQQARWLETHGAEYEPDLVLVFPYENDIYWNGETSYLRFPKPRYEANGKLDQRTLVDPGPRPWTDNWATTKALSALGGMLRGGHVGPLYFQPEGAEKPMLREFAPLLGDKLRAGLADEEGKNFLALAEARTRGAMINLRETAGKLGSALAVVPIPSHSAVDPDHRSRFGEAELGLPADAWDPNRPVELFIGLAKELGIKFLDPRGARRGGAGPAGARQQKHPQHTQ